MDVLCISIIYLENVSKSQTKWGFPSQMQQGQSMANVKGQK